MARAEARVELLMGTRVLARNGRPIGRIEEIRAETRGRELLVAEYLVGPAALLECLSAVSGARAILCRLGLSWNRGYRIRWDQIDLDDPARPRLTCRVEDLSIL
jgi:hypothetical protein